MVNRLNRPSQVSQLRASPFGTCLFGARLCCAFFAVLCIASDAVVYAQQPQSIPIPNANPSLVNPAVGLSSSDYMRLMEQANAARGITVVEANFPGAKPIPQAKLDPRGNPDVRADQSPKGYGPAIPTHSPTATPSNIPVAGIPSAVMPMVSFPSTPAQTIPAQTVSGPYVYADRSPTPPVPLLSGPAYSPSDRSMSTLGNTTPGVVIPSAVPNLPSATTYPEAPASSLPTPVSPYVSAHTLGLLNNPSKGPIGSGLVPEASPDTTVQQNHSPPYSTEPRPVPAYGLQSSMPNALGGNRSSVSLPSQSVPATVPRGPRWIAGYDTVWLKRAGDESTSFSHSGELGSFGVDQASRVSLAWQSEPMEYYEFVFLGSLVWNRSLVSDSSLSSVESQLQGSPSEPSWLTNMNGASSHTQQQRANLRSYELNKRWITDDLGNCFFGFNVIDYSEQFRFDSVRNGNTGSMGIDTTNLMAGLQGGIELWRPISQRIALGGNGLTGLYGNFAHGDWRMDSGTGNNFVTSADQFRIAGTLGVGARARYQFSSSCWAYGGYQWWYLAGLATVDNQPIGEVSSTASLDMTTNAGILVHGASCGLEFRF